MKGSSSSSSHKKKSSEGKKDKTMKRAVTVSAPIDIPNASSRRRQRETLVIGSPPAHSFLRSGDDVDSTPSPVEADFNAAEYTPGASEMMEEMQLDKDQGKKPWELIRQEDAVYIKMDMPGATKETVKVRVESGFLVIKGAREDDPELQQDDKKKTSNSTSARISLMSVYDQCRVSEMKAVMKNGVLKIKMPKVKEEKMTDIFDVQVD